MIRLDEDHDPALAERVERAGVADRASGRIDDEELARIARVVRRMRSGEDAPALRAEQLELLGRLTSEVAVDGAAPSGGERGPLPGLRRTLKRVLRAAVRLHTQRPLARQRDINVAIRAIADGMLARSEDSGR